MQTLKEIGKLIREQDNRITDCPLFIVQEKIRDYGWDSQYCDDYKWLDRDNEHSEASETRGRRLDALYDDGRDVEPYEKAYYRDRWEFVTACFTEQGCKDFLKRDGHNHNECRIYAAGSYRNEEFRAVREYLKGLT